jgi:hypothetical protein
MRRKSAKRKRRLKKPVDESNFLLDLEYGLICAVIDKWEIYQEASRTRAAVPETFKAFLPLSPRSFIKTIYYNYNDWYFSRFVSAMRSERRWISEPVLRDETLHRWAPLGPTDPLEALDTSSRFHFFFISLSASKLLDNRSSYLDINSINSFLIASASNLLEPIWNVRLSSSPSRLLLFADSARSESLQSQK